MMDTINQSIRKLFYKHFQPSLSKQVNVIAETDLKNFIHELGVLVVDLISKSSRDTYKESALVNVRDLEEMLVLARELRTCLEHKSELLTQDVIRIDELKQLEYKITEKLLTNR